MAQATRERGMTPGQNVYMNSARVVISSVTSRGLYVVVNGGRVVTVRRDRLRSCKARSDRGAKHTKGN